MMDIMEWKDRAKIAVILGSGLNDTIDEMMEIEETIPFHDIPDMPEATAPGHVGPFSLRHDRWGAGVCAAGASAFL